MSSLPGAEEPARLVLMVGVGTMGRGYVEAAARCGVQLLIVEMQSAIEDLRATYPGVIADAESVEAALYDDTEAWLAPSYRLAARHPVAGVVAFTEPHVIGAAYLQDALGLPGPGVRAAVASRNKAIQRSLLDAVGVPQPGWRLARGGDPVGDGDRVYGGPWVVKPLDSMGSHGVVMVADRTELVAELARRADALVLVEDYVGGEEFSWEAVVQDGTPRFTNITRKQTGEPPNFVETGHVVGVGAVSPEEAATVEALGVATVAALGVESSIVHMEAMICASGRAVVIETAVRAPGDFILGLVALATGVDVYEMCVRMAVGEGIVVPEVARSAAAIRFVGAEDTGVLTAVDVEPARRVPGVRHVELRVQPGATVHPPQASWERLAYVISTADMAEQALAIAGKAAAVVRIQIESVP